MPTKLSGLVGSSVQTSDTTYSLMRQVVTEMTHVKYERTDLLSPTN